MEFDHVLSVRCSVRRYTEEPVSEEDIQKIVKAGEEVPVGHFDFKNYAIAAITDKKVLRLLAEENQALSGRGDPIYGAPLLLLIMNTPEAREDSIKLNAGIMAENMHLKAVDLGLGSICIYSFIRTLNQEEGYGKYFQALHLPEGLKPAMAVAVGHTPMVQRERRFVARIPTFRIDGKG
ncbi:nitroreductase family protein [uncultured Dialister sp.]|jgi:nitroreductase|uniref:nitroreductase family protein n=1 Tax=Dialister succinatiphilus TaxID=487173 RepID=UPI002670485E|nr:nitroreductase family protein [uncultured Dialister sp.]